MKKKRDYDFCSAKKRTLQSFIVKKADTANFCNAKSRTLQSLRWTLQNCVMDPTKLYNVYYKTVHVIYTTNSGLSVIARARSNVDPNSHASQIVTHLLSSSHNHHLNHHDYATPPHRPQVTSTTNNNPRRPQTTTNAQPNPTTTRPRSQDCVHPPCRPHATSREPHHHE